jgi:hypothetical protein
LHRLLHDWEFISEDGGTLFELLESLNRHYDRRTIEGKVIKARKAAATRAKNTRMKGMFH